jgi:phospho-N-acetylmuramoyl-pentapeptide-transferase
VILWLGKVLHLSYSSLSVLRLVEYLSFRSLAAALTAVLVTLWATPRLIWFLHRRELVDQHRITGVPSASDKLGTPVMGGRVVVAAVLLACVLWCNLGNGFVLLVLFGMLWFGLIGLVDDLAKSGSRSGEKGLSEKTKLLLQMLFAAILVGVLLSSLSPLPRTEAAKLYMPFVKVAIARSALIYFPIVFVFVIVVGNSVNIADGLDGLAIVPSVFTVGVLGVFGYVIGNFIWSRYLFYPYYPGAGELTVFCSAFIGAGIGFLWFNAYPAQIFMGDTGSMAIGGAVAVICVLLKQEGLFLIAGGFFVVEALTSQIQDKIGIKWLGRRIFFRAPLHHQMQHTGLAETKVVIRLWIVSGILALVALATLKLR